MVVMAGAEQSPQSLTTSKSGNIMGRDLTDQTSTLYWLLECIQETVDNSISWCELGNVVSVGRKGVESVEINLLDGVLKTTSQETFQLHSLEQIVEVLTETGIFPENISF